MFPFKLDQGSNAGQVQLYWVNDPIKMKTNRIKGKQLDQSKKSTSRSGQEDSSGHKEDNSVGWAKAQFVEDN